MPTAIRLLLIHLACNLHAMDLVCTLFDVGMFFTLKHFKYKIILTYCLNKTLGKVRTIPEKVYIQLLTNLIILSFCTTIKLLRLSK